MTLNYADVAVKDDEQMNADFFNRRYQLIVAEIAAAEQMASLYGTTSTQLLQLGLTQINGVLGPLLTQLSQAATLGFLTASSATSVTLIVGNEATLTLAPANAPLFEPTSFLTIQDAGDDTKWASLQLVSYDRTSGDLTVEALYLSEGSTLTGDNWVVSASGAILPAMVALGAGAVSNATAAAGSATAAAGSATSAAGSAGAAATAQSSASTSAGAAVGAATAAAGSAAAAAASAASIAGGPVASIVGLTGIVGAAALAAAIGQTAPSTPNMDGTAAAGTATTFARADHTHPTDSSRAPLASPALTGAPTTPTAAASVSTTQIASTAFVFAQSSRTAVADAAYAALATDRQISYASLTSSRIVSLLSAASYPAGTMLHIVDETGNCSTTVTITAAANGSDHINGNASALICSAYGYLALVSDGVSKWTIVGWDLASNLAALSRSLPAAAGVPWVNTTSGTAGPVQVS